MYKDEPDYRRLFLAIFLAIGLLTAWQALVEWPRRQQLAELAKVNEAKRIEEEKQRHEAQPLKAGEETAALSREERLALSPRLAVASEKLHGSIALKGARFDDLRLAKYRVALEEDSSEVTLLSPGGKDDLPYVLQAGWLAPDASVKVPGQTSLWQADARALTPQTPVTLRWDNGEGITFVIALSLDEDYMFTLTQRVENRSGRAVSVIPYGYINRAYGDTQQHYGILHEGPLGVMEGALEEISYKELRDEGAKVFENAAGWLGITDKYWLTALIPGEPGYKANFSHYQSGDADRYQADYLGKAVAVAAGGSAESHLRMFAGAKEIEALDAYTEGAKGAPPIPLFDRAVDFGVLYFMTKPMFLTLNFFFTHIGNFGIAILLLTIVVKLLMYPLANKSYHSMAEMRELQPEMAKLRERHASDPMAMNKAMMELYRSHKVNPASGCLPLLIQMPVFFALYKVLYVTIEMRHAPFFGWLRDLSAPDPSNVFTLFGLVPWDHPAWLHLGLLPILFTATMVIQMKQQPKPTDPVQAKVIAWMPYFFLFLFAAFPAGLVLYWVWSNMLSILQQHVISRRHHAKMLRKKARAA